MNHSYCWNCNEELSFIYNLDGEIITPVEDEIAICVGCCAANIFRNSKFEKFTAKDVVELQYKNLELYRDVIKLQIIVKNEVSYAHN
jgi:hypothetical protein